MRAVAGLGLVLVVQGADYPDSPPLSFEADVTITETGLTRKGHIAFDAVGKRSYEYINELEQTSYKIQEEGSLNTLSFTVIPTKPTPTCVCDKLRETAVDDPWYWFLGGAKNSTGCSGGSLYSNAMKGYPGTGVTQPFTNLCLNGQTPVYSDDGARKITFDTFTPGRPKNFNMSVLEPFLPNCAQNCNYGKAKKYTLPLLSKATPSPKVGDPAQEPPASFSADVTFKSSTSTDKGTYAVDAVARRSYMYHEGSESTKLVIQEDGYLETYVYTIIATQPNPTCVCKRFSPSAVQSPWFIYLDGAQNSSGCSGGSLYTNSMKAYPGAGSSPIPQSICLNGATPVYTEAGDSRITFDTFTAGRPAAWNVSALTQFLPACVRDCNDAGVGETVASELFRFPENKAVKRQTAPKKKVAAAGNWPQSPAASFSAEVTFTAPGGVSSKGTVQWDSVARRAYTTHADSQQTKYTLQNVENRLQTYVYTVVPTQPSPTCVCNVLENTDVRDPWYIFMGGAMNSTGCSGGTLYTNEMEGFAGSNILPPPSSICMNGNTPVYSEHGSSRVTYDSFTAGRPSEWNTTALEEFLPSCSLTCNTVRGQGVFHHVVHNF